MNHFSWIHSYNRLQRIFLHMKYAIKIQILPLLYPRHCPFCQEILPYSTYVCKSCQKKLPLIHSPVCYRCGKPLNQDRQELCYDCRIFPKSFDQGLALFLYNSMTRRSMIEFKYHNQRYLSDFFVRSICSMHLQTLKKWNLDAIIPIPIHKNKRKKRGYNQAELLAKQLAYHLNLPCYTNLLIRQIDTLPQKQFSPQSRLNNLNRAFAINQHYLKVLHQDSNHDTDMSYLAIPLKRVLLIDDIFTTGATMESCSRLLKSVGVSHVYIYSVCIGMARDEIL